MKNLLCYFKYTGLASRLEFWTVQLITIILLINLSMLITYNMNYLLELMIVNLLICWLILYTATWVRRCRDASIRLIWLPIHILFPVISFLVVGLTSTKTKKNNLSFERLEPGFSANINSIR